MIDCNVLPGAFDQRVYPGAGDVDDCWIVATCWAAKASDPKISLPTVTTFRRYAGDPDDGKSDGGSLEEVIAGARGCWPDLPVTAYNGPWSGFIAAVGSGRIASLAVLSGRLPASYRYGFAGWHQVGIAACDSGLVMMNPLQANGSRPRAIAPSAIEYAATALGNVRAALFPPRTAQEVTSAMQLDDPADLTGTAVLGVSWRLWRVADDTATPAVPKGTSFRVLGSVRYHKSAKRPEGYVGYLVDYSGELHVLPSENVSTFTPAPTPDAAYNAGVAAAAKLAASAKR